jgi:hypothetical protein
MLSAQQALAALLNSPVAMGVLDSGPCTLEHVSLRNPDGPDVRQDSCPCDRKLAKGEKPIELGEDLYVSSSRHTLGDLVRDVLKEK